jgi:AcrR family transcriptional regulator
MTLGQVPPGVDAPRPLRADAERNRQRILAAAAQVFAQRGLDAGLDEIARRAGVGTGTVYRRFPDKTLLIEALFESRIDALLELAETALAMADSWAGLVHFLERSTAMQLADRGFKDLLFGDARCAAAVASRRIVARLEQLIPTASAIVARAQADGRLRADVSVTDLAVIQFMLHGVGVFGGTVEPELWRRQLALMLDGLRAGPPGPSGPSGPPGPLPVPPLTVAQLETICLK